MKINGDKGRRIFCQQSIYDRGNFRGGGRRRQCINGTILIVRNLEAVEEIAKKIFVCADQPDLECLGCNCIVCALFKLRRDPSVLVFARFTFDENGAQFVKLRKGLEGNFVDRGFLFMEERDHTESHISRHACENLVRFEHRGGQVKEVRKFQKPELRGSVEIVR